MCLSGIDAISYFMPMPKLIQEGKVQLILPLLSDLQNMHHLTEHYTKMSCINSESDDV